MRLKIGVNAYVEGLPGASMLDVVSVLGAPTRYELAGDSGTLLYQLASVSEGFVGTDGDGDITAGVVLTLACEVTLEIENGLVKSGKTAGGLCWAYRL